MQIFPKDDCISKEADKNKMGKGKKLQCQKALNSLYEEQNDTPFNNIDS